MLKEIENKINRINYTLVHHKLVLGRRYNYYALDLYINRFNEDKSKVLAEWKNSWFKGQYENIEAKIISQNKGKKWHKKKKY